MKQRLPVHGRDHRVGGSDPIPGLSALDDAIKFGIENDGNWLDVRTSTTGPSSQGIYLQATVGSGATPGILLDTDGILKLSSNDVILGLNEEVEITPTLITISGNGAQYPRLINMQLFNLTTTPQGSKFQVIGPDGATSLLEVRDDGTVHIPTGGTIVADL